MTYGPAALRREVVGRAGNRCEYSLLPAELAFYPHEVDHVIDEKHGGANDINNFAFACWRCNRHKGNDLTSSTLRPDNSALPSTRGHKSGQSTSLTKVR